MLASHCLYRARLLLLLAVVFRRAYSYTWLFEEAPSQCGQITVTVTGSDATPPFRVLIVPFGLSSLPGGVDSRSVLDIPFSGDQNSVKFQLTYPENLQFVAVVSLHFFRETSDTLLFLTLPFIQLDHLWSTSDIHTAKLVAQFAYAVPARYIVAH